MSWGRRFASIIAFLAAFCGLSASLRAEDPALQNVLSAVTLDFKNEGETDRAVLTQNADDAANLYIYFSTPDPNSSEGAFKLILAKKSVVSAGSMWGQHPSLGVNDKGSLVITSSNTAVGREKWTQSLTIAFRNNEFVIAGITFSTHDGLDPKAGGHCDLNLLAGKGLRNGKPVSVSSPPIKLADWSDEKSLPKECQF